MVAYLSGARNETANIVLEEVPKILDGVEVRGGGNLLNSTFSRANLLNSMVTFVIVRRNKLQNALTYFTG